MQQLESLVIAKCQCTKLRIKTKTCKFHVNKTKCVSARLMTMNFEFEELSLNIGIFKF